MHESDTYQAILDEGAIRATQKIVLRQGRKRFGEPNESVRQAILAINDVEPLEKLTEKLLDVTSWEELLAAQ